MARPVPEEGEDHRGVPLRQGDVVQHEPESPQPVVLPRGQKDLSVFEGIPYPL